MTEQLLLYIPGFPGEAIPRETGETRVVDIVTELLIKKNINFEIINYPGINDNDSFTFEKSKHHVLQVVKNKINQGYALTLIGQSWGGLLSLLALNHFKFDQLLLITPFLLNLPKNEIINILKIYSKEFPDLVPLDSIDKSSEEVQSIMNSLNKVLQKDNNQTTIKILINMQDEIIPADALKDIFFTSNIFKSKMSLTTSYNDHNFSQGKNDLRNWIKSNV